MGKGTVYLESKPHYEILDGLRGVAAFMVILFHIFETYSWKTGVQHINHGYLAVDFFFVLSGFVIGYAYDDRWDKMTTWGFFKRRLIRLHPMVVAGSVVGLCLFFFRDCEMFPIGQDSGWLVLLAFVMSLFMIPCGPRIGTELHVWDELNPLNGPSWTLTYEYVANILYALIFRRLPKAALAALCACAAFLTLNITMGWDVFGLFPEGTGFTVIGGWNLTVPQIFMGFTRLLYPFLCGLLISRILRGRTSAANPSGSPLHARGGFWWCALILVIVFSIPQIGGYPRARIDGLYQAVAILAVFPLVVMLGAGSRVSDPRSAKVCKFLGDISFPIYITHYPIMYCQMAWVLNHPDAPLWMHFGVNISTVILSVGLAWALVKLYDQPLRQRLTSRFLHHR